MNGTGSGWCEQPTSTFFGMDLLVILPELLRLFHANRFYGIVDTFLHA